MAKRVYVRQSQVQAAQQLVKRSAITGRLVSKSIKKIAEPKSKVVKTSARSKMADPAFSVAFISGEIALPEAESSSPEVAPSREASVHPGVQAT